jgi:hypothetical protein
MSAVWTVKDSDGQLLPQFVSTSRLDVGRKLLPDRYDAFRLHVSSSYREVFERTLHQALKREAWQIVRVKSRRISAHGSETVLVPPAIANGAPVMAKRQLGDVLI